MSLLRYFAAVLVLFAAGAGCEPSPPALQPAVVAVPPPAPTSLTEPAPAPAPAPAAVRARPPAPAPAAALPRIDVRLDREWVERLRMGDGRIWGSATITPARDRAGRPAGLTLTDMRPDGLYGSAGLRDGDTVRAVNGLPLTSEAQALEAYSALRAATRVELVVVRNGAPLIVVVLLGY